MQKRMEDKPEGKEPSLKQHTRQALQYNQSWKQLGKHQPIISLQKKKKPNHWHISGGNRGIIKQVAV